MGIISDLKFIAKDKQFINDKFVKRLGGLTRIMQFLKLDFFIDKQINFYRKELNKKDWNMYVGYDEEKAFLEHTSYFEQVLRQEALFLAQLQTLERYDELARKDSMKINDAQVKLFNAARWLDKKLENWRTNRHTTTYRPREVLKILRWVYNQLTSNRPWHVGVG